MTVIKGACVVKTTDISREGLTGNQVERHTGRGVERPGDDSRVDDGDHQLCGATAEICSSHGDRCVALSLLESGVVTSRAPRVRRFLFQGIIHDFGL